MFNDWPLFACLFLALWSAIVGGVFSAFSEFVMPALTKTTPTCGIEAIQQINRDVIGTQFVAGIILIAPLCVMFAVYCLLAYEDIVIWPVLSAAGLYLLSVFGITVVGNVPMNNRLDAMDKSERAAAAYWQEYGRNWTRMNHIRCIGSIGTSCLMLAGAFSFVCAPQA